MDLYYLLNIFLSCTIVSHPRVFTFIAWLSFYRPILLVRTSTIDLYYLLIYMTDLHYLFHLYKWFVLLFLLVWLTCTTYLTCVSDLYYLSQSYDWVVLLVWLIWLICTTCTCVIDFYYLLGLYYWLLLLVGLVLLACTTCWAYTYDLYYLFVYTSVLTLSWLILLGWTLATCMSICRTCPNLCVSSLFVRVFVDVYYLIHLWS